MFWSLIAGFGGIAALLSLIGRIAGFRVYETPVTFDDKTSLYHTHAISGWHLGRVVLRASGDAIHVGLFINVSKMCFGWVAQEQGAFDSSPSANTGKIVFVQHGSAFSTKKSPITLWIEIAERRTRFASDLPDIETPRSWQVRTGNHVSSVFESRGRAVVLLLGRPGIGKSTFAAYISRRVGSIKSLTVLESHSISSVSGSPGCCYLLEEADKMWVSGKADTAPNKSTYNIIIDHVQRKTNTMLIMTSNLSLDDFKKVFGADYESMFRPGRVDIIEYVDA